MKLSWKLTKQTEIEKKWNFKNKKFKCKKCSNRNMQKLSNKFELGAIPSFIDGFPKVIAQKKAIVK